MTDATMAPSITRAVLSRILNGASTISADMDARLSKALGNDIEITIKPRHAGQKLGRIMAEAA